jgi:hypothetical protein
LHRLNLNNLEFAQIFEFEYILNWTSFLFEQILNLVRFWIWSDFEYWSVFGFGQIFEFEQFRFHHCLDLKNVEISKLFKLKILFRFKKCFYRSISEIWVEIGHAPIVYFSHRMKLFFLILKSICGIRNREGLDVSLWTHDHNHADLTPMVASSLYAPNCNMHVIAECLLIKKKIHAITRVYDWGETEAKKFDSLRCYNALDTNLWSIYIIRLAFLDLGWNPLRENIFTIILN